MYWNCGAKNWKYSLFAEWGGGVGGSPRTSGRFRHQRWGKISCISLGHLPIRGRPECVYSILGRLLTSVEGSIFGPFSQTLISKTSLHERDFKFCFTWYPTDIILCLWSGLISPRIGTFVEKRFHGLFPKKKDSNLGGVPSFPSWSWGQLSPQRNTFPMNYLDYLKNRLKSGDMVVFELTFRNVSLRKWSKNWSCYRRHW